MHATHPNSHTHTHAQVQRMDGYIFQRASKYLEYSKLSCRQKSCQDPATVMEKFGDPSNILLDKFGESLSFTSQIFIDFQLKSLENG